jgi:peptide-methionine (S)-S-oxide reductase
MGMSKASVRTAAMMLIVLAGALACRAGSSAPVPAPVANETRAATSSKQTAAVAGGCFWGVQAVFQHVKGVVSVTSGYAGGTSKNPDYEMVSSGDTGHAESVLIVYDPSKVTYGELLRVFFSVALDPTEVNRQGPDEGTQYRSIVFYQNDQQKQIAEAYIAQLNAAKVFSKPIATQVTPMKEFYTAEGYHQNYATLHPDNPYIVYNDAPKVANLRRELPDLYYGK